MRAVLRYRSFYPRHRRPRVYPRLLVRPRPSPFSFPFSIASPRTNGRVGSSSSPALGKHPPRYTLSSNISRTCLARRPSSKRSTTPELGTRRRAASWARFSPRMRPIVRLVSSSCVDPGSPRPAPLSSHSSLFRIYHSIVWRIDRVGGKG